MQHFAGVIRVSFSFVCVSFTVDNTDLLIAVNTHTPFLLFFGCSAKDGSYDGKTEDMWKFWREEAGVGSDGNMTDARGNVVEGGKAGQGTTSWGTMRCDAPERDGRGGVVSI